MAGSNNKIFCILTPPRSRSTLLFRYLYMLKLGKYFHEPATPCFGFKYAKQYWDIWAEDGVCEHYPDMHKKIMEAHQQGHVIIKDMITPFFSEALTSFKDVDPKCIYPIILIRNPITALNSMYTKMGTIDPKVEKFLGYDSILPIINTFSAMGVRAPLVFDSDDLVRSPEATISQIRDFTGLDIPFKPTWDPLPSEFDFKTEWHEYKKRDQIYHWHGDAIMSSGFKSRLEKTSTTVAEKDRETYDKILSSLNIIYRHILAENYNMKNDVLM
jgi:hypothetical protein